MAATESVGNRIEIDGVIEESEPLRHTPAGIPIARFVLRHASTQREAGAERAVELTLGCMATEEDARFLAAMPLGTRIALTGFLAPKSISSRQLVLHITRYAIKDKDTNDAIR